MTPEALDDVWSRCESRVDPEEVDRARDEAGRDEVVCIVCARQLGQITEQHLRTHGLTLEKYQSDHPEAPIYPEDSAQRPGREPGFTHSRETKRKIGASARRNHQRGVYER